MRKRTLSALLLVAHSLVSVVPARAVTSPPDRTPAKLAHLLAEAIGPTDAIAITQLKNRYLLAVSALAQARIAADRETEPGARREEEARLFTARAEALDVLRELARLSESVAGRFDAESFNGSQEIRGQKRLGAGVAAAAVALGAGLTLLGHQDPGVVLPSTVIGGGVTWAASGLTAYFGLLFSPQIAKPEVVFRIFAYEALKAGLPPELLPPASFSTSFVAELSNEVADRVAASTPVGLRDLIRHHGQALAQLELAPGLPEVDAAMIREHRRLLPRAPRRPSERWRSRVAPQVLALRAGFRSRLLPALRLGESSGEAVAHALLPPAHETLADRISERFRSGASSLIRGEDAASEEFVRRAGPALFTPRFFELESALFERRWRLGVRMHSGRLDQAPEPGVIPVGRARLRFDLIVTDPEGDSVALKNQEFEFATRQPKADTFAIESGWVDPFAEAFDRALGEHPLLKEALGLTGEQAVAAVTEECADPLATRVTAGAAETEKPVVRVGAGPGAR